METDIKEEYTRLLNLFSYYRDIEPNEKLMMETFYNIKKIQEKLMAAIIAKKF